MGDHPPKMRKSLLSQQAAKDGLSFNSSNVDGLLQDLPRNLKLSAPSNRIRNLSSRRPVSTRPSSLVTPVSRTLPPKSGTSSSAIPRPAARRLNVTESLSRSRPRTAGPGVRNAGVAFGSATSRTTVKPTMSRSISVENMADSTMNMYRTPASRARSRSPGSGTRDKPTVTKLGNIPSTKDRDVLNGMVEKIISVLSALGYPQDLSVASFRSLGGTDLQKIFSFLIQLMVGPNCGKDEVTYIHEGLCMLGCPVASLSKSQLKTLSIPHVLPATITALAWLACYIEEFMGLKPGLLDQPDICDDEQEVDNETWDSYKRLFFSEISGGDVNLLDELESYRNRLTAIYDHNPDISLSDLKAELHDKMKYKETVFAQEDPRLSVMTTLKAQDEILEHEGKRLEELESKFNKYSNLTALQSDQTHLESTLRRLQRELESLRQSLNGQPLSKAEAQRKLNEIADMRKQQDSLIVVLENLEKKLHQQQQFLRNDQNRFYEVCSGFSVLDMFNNAARNWGGIVPQLEKNPFDVAKMKNWLKGVKQRLATSKRMLEKRREHYLEEERLCATVCETLDANICTLEEECNRLASELSFQGHEHQEKMEHVAFELEREEKELEDLVKGVQQLTTEIEVKKQALAEVEKHNEEDDKKIESMTEQLKELDAKVERLHAQHSLAEVELQAYLLAYITDARAKVHAPLSELDDPEFRRLAIARYREGRNSNPGSHGEGQPKTTSSSRERQTGSDSGGAA